MNRQARKDLFASTLDCNSSFWKTVKPLLNSKYSTSEEKLLLVENGNVVSNEAEVSNIFNLYFNRITDNLNIPPILKKSSQDPDPVFSAVTTLREENFADFADLIKIREIKFPRKLSFFRIREI